MSIMQRNPKKIMQLKFVKQLYDPEQFFRQLTEDAKREKINAVDPLHFFMTLLSLVGYPFAMQYVLHGNYHWSEKDFVNFIRERETMIYDILMNI